MSEHAFSLNSFFRMEVHLCQNPECEMTDFSLLKLNYSFHGNNFTTVYHAILCRCVLNCQITHSGLRHIYSSICIW